MQRDIYTCNSENEALAYMKEQSDADVRTCVLPTFGNVTYYCSESGDIYTMRKRKDGGLSVYKINCKQTMFSGVFFRMQEYSGMVRVVQLSRLIYCTFALGYWDNDMKFEFVDGNPKNCALENIRPKEELLTPHSSQMTMPDYIKQSSKR